MLGSKPPDVPDYIDTTTGLTYASGTNAGVIGDGVGDRGSPMPALANQPAAIDTPANLVDDWTNTGGQADDLLTPGSGEAKFRTLGSFAFMGFIDPIRHYGQDDQSHLHMFFGAANVSPWSTYSSLRTQANSNAALGRVASTVAGGPLNGTAYWMPPFTKVIGGNTYAIPMSHAIIYYSSNPWDLAKYSQRLMRGQRYITGTNMSDPTDSAVKAEIAAANAQPGTAGRYAYRGNGYEGITAYQSDRTTIIQTTASENTSKCIKNPDGTDPWGGALPVDGWFKMAFTAPRGIDGRNLWSPDGYSHMRHAVNDTQGGLGLPEGWYAQAELVVTVWIPHKGWADYSTWSYASDAIALANHGFNEGVGGTAHLDWMGAWNEEQFDTITGMQGDCLGADGVTPHTCNNSTFNATSLKYLVGAFNGENAPDLSRTPQVPIPDRADTDTPADLVLIPTTTTGSFSAVGVAA